MNASERRVETRKVKFQPGSKCPVCMTEIRLKYVVGKGLKNSRGQHTRWYVCKKGHQIYKKKNRRA
jgi:uncharacterized protein with PIN domain